MQRWMMIAGIVFMLGLVGLTGGYVWLKNERANRPDRIWVPIALNPELTHEQHETFAEELYEQLVTDEILASVASDLGLQQRWNHSSSETTVEELHERVFIEIGEHQHMPSLNIGFTGIRRENELLREMTSRLIEDFQEMMQDATRDPQ